MHAAISQGLYIFYKKLIKLYNCKEPNNLNILTKKVLKYFLHMMESKKFYKQFISISFSFELIS